MNFPAAISFRFYFYNRPVIQYFQVSIEISSHTCPFEFVKFRVRISVMSDSQWAAASSFAFQKRIYDPSATFFIFQVRSQAQCFQLFLIFRGEAPRRVPNLKFSNFLTFSYFRTYCFIFIVAQLFALKIRPFLTKRSVQILMKTSIIRSKPKFEILYHFITKFSI